jgi:hypothetical protein
MSWILQDAIVTSLALGAAAVLARRIVDVVRPSERQSPCASCGSCAPAASERSTRAVVPLSALRRRPEPAD